MRCSPSTAWLASLLTATHFTSGRLRRFPDRACIARVGLVGAHERPHVLRGNQTHFVPLARQPAPPVVRAAAGLQHHPARLTRAHEFLKLRPSHRLGTDLARLRIHPVHAEHPLCDVHGNCRNLVHEKPPSLSGCPKLHFGTSMPLDREASPFTFSIALPSPDHATRAGEKGRRPCPSPSVDAGAFRFCGTMSHDRTPVPAQQTRPRPRARTGP